MHFTISFLGTRLIFHTWDCGMNLTASTYQTFSGKLTKVWIFPIGSYMYLVLDISSNIWCVQGLIHCMARFSTLKNKDTQEAFHSCYSCGKAWQSCTKVSAPLSLNIQVHSLGFSLDLSVLVHLCTIFPLCPVVLPSVVDILSTWSKEKNIFYLYALGFSTQTHPSHMPWYRQSCLS